MSNPTAHSKTNLAIAAGKMELEKLRRTANIEGKLLNHMKAFQGLDKVKLKFKLKIWQKALLVLFAIVFGFLTLVGLGIVR